MASFFRRLGDGIRDGVQDLAMGVAGEQTGEVLEYEWQCAATEHGLTLVKNEGFGAKFGIMNLDAERDTPVEDYGAAIIADAASVEDSVGGARSPRAGDIVVQVNGLPMDDHDATLAALGAAARPMTLTLRRRVPRDGGQHSVLGAVNWRLEEEMGKAAAILKDFVAASVAGERRAPPPEELRDARGFAVLRVTKLGLWLSARFGSGLVVARTDGGAWSAPSAIGTLGASVGLQAGASVGDVILVLRSDVAVAGFAKNGFLGLSAQLQYGAQAGASAGGVGLGREAAQLVEGDGARSPVLAYAVQRGVYAGVSLDGGAITERAYVNQRYYSAGVSAAQLLTGQVPPPCGDGAEALYAALAEVDKLPPTRVVEPASAGGVEEGAVEPAAVDGVKEGGCL